MFENTSKGIDQLTSALEEALEDGPSYEAFRTFTGQMSEYELRALKGISEKAQALINLIDQLKSYDVEEEEVEE